MLIRNSWMSDNQSFGDDYPNNLLLTDAIRRFEIQRTSSLEGEDVLVDGVPERVVVQNHTNPLNQSKYDKKISFAISSPAHSGSLLVFHGKTWLVTSKMFDKKAYKVGSVLECNQTLTIQTGSTQVLIGTDAMNRPVYDTHPTYTSYPCVVDSKVQNPYDNLNAAISLPEGSISVIIPYTSQVAENMQFEMWNYDYKIIGINNQYILNNEGPMIITAQRVVK